MRCEMTLQQRGVEGIRSEFTLMTDEVAGWNHVAMSTCEVLPHGLKRHKDLFTSDLFSTLGTDALGTSPSVWRVRAILEFNKLEVGMSTFGDDRFHKMFVETLFSDAIDMAWFAVIDVMFCLEFAWIGHECWHYGSQKAETLAFK